jgi:hypothetical protein
MIGLNLWPSVVEFSDNSSADRLLIAPWSLPEEVRRADEKLREGMVLGKIALLSNGKPI